MLTAELRRLNTDLFCDTHFARYICYYTMRVTVSHIVVLQMLKLKVTNIAANGFKNYLKLRANFRKLRPFIVIFVPKPTA